MVPRMGKLRGSDQTFKLLGADLLCQLHKFLAFERAVKFVSLDNQKQAFQI